MSAPEATAKALHSAVKAAVQLEKKLAAARLELTRAAIDIGAWLESPELPAGIATAMGSRLCAVLESLSRIERRDG